MPALIPPLIDAGLSLPLIPDFAPPVAFVAGVLGAPIGADLLHLKEVVSIAPAVASIGGPGTLDGIFLSGLIAGPAYIGQQFLIENACRFAASCRRTVFRWLNNFSFGEQPESNQCWDFAARYQIEIKPRI